MLSNKLNKGFALSLLSASVFLTACGGGGGGGGGSNSGGGNEPSQYQGVSGPLDAAQEPLSTQVFGSLGDAVADTPLAAPVACLDQVVVEDVLDVLDAIAATLDPAALADPQAALEAATANIQLAATELTVDLPNLLASLAGQGDCSGNTAAGGNPLQGSDLEDLGAALEAVFANGGGDPGSLDLMQLAALFDDLSTAFSDGIAGVPAEVSEAPILGGALTTLDVALADLAVAVNAVAVQDSDASASAIATTLNHLLNNVLINVVPIGFIEEQSGQAGLFSGPISDGIGEATAAVDDGLGQALAPLFDGLATLLDAIAGGTAGGFDGGSGAGPTGTPLDAVLAPLAELETLLAAGGSGGGDGVTGTPLDLLLAPLVTAIEGNGAASCPLVDTPLAPACSVVDSLLGALAADPGADPTAVLTGLVESLLGMLGLGSILG